MRPKPKVKIGIGIVSIILLSIWMSVASNPLSGIATFFILTLLLWVVARIRDWI
ncbi:MAG TPA: hypothetical protein VLJ16_04725 [Acidobacteriota bacterium]|nr:hypothetical protein [Acidobacteriota bacterium]